MVYVSDQGNGRIVVFKNDGTFSRNIGSWGAGNGQFLNAQGIAVDSNGTIYVCDPAKQQVQIFQNDGTYVSSMFSASYRLTIDSSNNLYTAEPDAGQVLQFLRQ